MYKEEMFPEIIYSTFVYYISLKSVKSPQKIGATVLSANCNIILKTKFWGL